MSVGRSALLGLLAAISGFVVNILTSFFPIDGPYPRWQILAAGGGVLVAIVVITAIIERSPNKAHKAQDELWLQLLYHRVALSQLEARCRAHDRWTTGCVDEWGRHQREIELLKEALRKAHARVSDAPIDTAPAPGVGCLMRLALVARDATALLAFPLVAFFAGYGASSVITRMPREASRLAWIEVTRTPRPTAHELFTLPTDVLVAGIVSPTLTSPDRIALSPTAQATPKVNAQATEAATATLRPVPKPPQPKPPTAVLQLAPTRTAVARTPTVAAPPVAILAPVMPAESFFVGQDSTIELRWQPFARPLAENEHFLVTMWFEREGAIWRDYQWTKQTSLVVPKYLYDLLTDSRKVRWQVELVSLLKGEPAGDPQDRVRTVAAMPAQLQFEWARPQIAAPAPTQAVATPAEPLATPTP